MKLAFRKTTIGTEHCVGIAYYRSSAYIQRGRTIIMAVVFLTHPAGLDICRIFGYVWKKKKNYKSVTTTRYRNFSTQMFID